MTFAMALHSPDQRRQIFRHFRDRNIVEGDASWTEITKVCSDLIGGVSQDLKQNTEWQIELLDQHGKPVFRIRLVAETLN